ncbi:MAG: hypothetical protein ACK5LT_06440 [Lachnospirales bacterium]
MKGHQYFIFIVILFLACNSKPKEAKKLVVSNQMGQLMLPKNKLNLFCYFKAECSFCYGNIMNISKEFPKIPLVCITECTDTVLISHHMNQINFKGVLVIDSLSNFYKSNKDILKNNKLLLVDHENKVVDSAEFELNKIITKRFKEKIKKYTLEK